MSRLLGRGRKRVGGGKGTPSLAIRIGENEDGDDYGGLGSRDDTGSDMLLLRVLIWLQNRDMTVLVVWYFGKIGFFVGKVLFLRRQNPLRRPPLPPHPRYLCPERKDLGHLDRRYRDRTPRRQWPCHCIPKLLPLKCHLHRRPSQMEEVNCCGQRWERGGGDGRQARGA